MWQGTETSGHSQGAIEAWEGAVQPGPNHDMATAPTKSLWATS